jgi:hypothetical protein
MGDDILVHVVTQIPAFTDSTLVRNFGETRYFFFRVGLVEVSVPGRTESQLTVFGRIVKDTVLKRTQIYSKESGLIPDERSMPSAPSAFFALDLNNHKLVYLPDTAEAPSVSVFAATLDRFLKRKHATYVRSLRDKLKKSPEPKSLETLFREYPQPQVEATPMASKGSINEFLNSFEKLTRLEFQVLRTNAEIPRGDMFRLLRQMKDQMHAASTKLVHNNKEGLDKEEALNEIDASASAGNQKVVLNGVGADGTVLSGSNDNFKLRIPAVDLPVVPAQRAAHMVQAYFKQVDEGRLRPDIPGENGKKVEQLRIALNETANKN